MDVTNSARAAALWISLNLIVLVVLSALVVRQRMTRGVMVGDGGSPELIRAGRAFGNAAEYVPAALAAMIALAITNALPAVIHMVGAALFVGRIAHALGISHTENASPGRTIGIVLTWSAILIAATALLLRAFA
ncbi:MAG TPA: MAPEG family protein [Caulobacteraceae bacterium]|jgi:hypothetical protein